MNNAPTGSEIRLSILVPVRNDGINVRTIIKVITALVDTSHEVLVVHDTPDDDAVTTVADLQTSYPNISRVFNERGRGVVRAIASGVAAARGDYVMILAADDIGPVVIVDRLVRIMDRGCQFLSLTRYSKGGKCFGGSRFGRLLSRIANRAFRIMSSSTFGDCTFGLKMFRRDAFVQFNLSDRHTGWSFAFEMSIKAQMMGMRIAEYPVVSLNRIFDEGQSTFTAYSWIKTYLRWFFYGVRHLPPFRRKAMLMPTDGSP